MTNSRLIREQVPVARKQARTEQSGENAYAELRVSRRSSAFGRRSPPVSLRPNSAAQHKGVLETPPKATCQTCASQRSNDLFTRALPRACGDSEATLEPPNGLVSVHRKPTGILGGAHDLGVAHPRRVERELLPS